jgi:hypothetical protein
MKETISTHNVNEATYYILNGASFVKASYKTLYVRTYKVQSEPKKNFNRWQIHLKDVPSDIIDIWWKGVASWNIQDFMEARDLLKKRIVLFLHEDKNCED